MNKEKLILLEAKIQPILLKSSFLRSRLSKLKKYIKENLKIALIRRLSLIS